MITLAFPPGARATGTGEAFTGLSDDATATYYNPAGLGLSPLANSWKVYLVDKGHKFTALASKKKKDFGAKSIIWAGTQKGLLRYNGKVWEECDYYLIEDNDNLENVVDKHIDIEDEKLLQRAMWKIRSENGIGMKDRSVLVAMSGGVDSSVAAGVLAERGFRVLGLTMLLAPEGAPGAGEPDAVRDAGEVCRILGIPHETMDLREEFRSFVVEPFVRTYLAGKTPNPCILCNEQVKFRFLFESAARAGADMVATGHYARILENGSRGLGRGADPDLGSRNRQRGGRLPRS